MNGRERCRKLIVYTAGDAKIKTTNKDMENRLPNSKIGRI